MIIGIEKTLTCLAMPCGLIWLGLIALTLLAWRREQRAMFVSLLVVVAFYTLAGSEAVSKVLVAKLEREFVGIDPLEQGPYDAVVVLGGGTRTAINGQPQLSASGDRAALGARLYHAGRTRRLITTGQEYATERRGSAYETSVIWRQLAVPDKDIVRLPGRNTREEMAAIRQMVKEHPEWRRLGLVTSAWHMPRALRLAQKNDLSLEPLPAHILGNEVRWEPWLLIIPNATGFLHSQHACKEILARLAGQ